MHHFFLDSACKGCHDISLLSDLLNSVWQSLGPSIQGFKCHYFIIFNGWVTFHCIYVTHLLYPFLCQWTFRLLPCLGYCKQCCNEHWGCMYPFRPCYSLGICSGVGLPTYIAPFLVFKGTSILFSRVAVPGYIPTNR